MKPTSLAVLKQIEQLDRTLARLVAGTSQPPVPEMSYGHPDCRRCGDPSTVRFMERDQAERDAVPLCDRCFDQALRQAHAPRYEPTEADCGKAREEIEARSMCSGRLETKSLVIQGNNIRFKSAKENLAQYGMPKELEAPLKALKKGPLASSIDDPFEFSAEGE